MTMRRACRVLLVAIALAIGIGGHTVASRQPIAGDLTLIPGVPVARELAAAETQTLRLSLRAGQYAQVVIEQPRANVLQRLRGPDGFLLDGLGGPDLQTFGLPDRVVIVAEQDADFTIEAWTITGVPARYVATLTETGEATEIERARFEAQRLLATAVLGGNSRPWLPERRAAIERSVATSRRIGDLAGEVRALLSLGLSHWLGDQRLAHASLLAALDAAGRAGDARSGEEALNDLGEVSILLGEPRSGADFLRRALESRQRRDPSGAMPLFRHNLSVAYRGAGEFQQALRYGHEALAMWRDEGSAEGQAFARHNLGVIHHLLGDSAAALEHIDQSLALFRSVSPRHNGVGVGLHVLGTVRAATGDHTSAIAAFQQSMQLWRTTATPDVTAEGRAATGLGNSMAALGRWREAGEAYARALELFRAAGARANEADALRGIGAVHHADGEPAAALARFAEALPLHRAAEDRAGEAATLLAAARAERDRDHFVAARTHIERALDLLESLRTAVASQELRASFVASKRDYYDFYIDLLMRLHRREPAAGHLVSALMASERGRARSLLETLTESNSDLRAGAPAGLIEREQALRQDVTFKAARLTRLLSSGRPPEQSAPARSDLDAAVRAYEDAQARIREESPRYAALVQPAPLDLAALRERVLDDDTALLEYALGAERSYLWVVTRRTITAYELPKAAVIEAAAREAHGLLAATDRREAWGPAERASARLSDLVFGPIARHLAYKRLLVVPDGALHYIPFAALPHPGTTTPLVATHEIISLPSASALEVIRRETSGRVPAARAVAVFADPVLGSSDPRVQSAPARHATPPANANASDLLRSAAESGIPRFDRLVHTRAEADAIAQVAGAAQTLHSVDFAASRAAALGPRLADYRIVHFATHGLINNRHPQLSGLVLSLVDARGNPQDGFVRLHDIYNMRLGADLVVLSACRTALGHDVRGEGFVGLTRGFMYAGAPRVVASLWDVRDRATAELMRRFYSQMLSGGMAPAAALRAAQVSMWQEPRWRAPVHWAGFVIQGEWN